jgi:hypothetical protein
MTHPVSELQKEVRTRRCADALIQVKARSLAAVYQTVRRWQPRTNGQKNDLPTRRDLRPAALWHAWAGWRGSGLAALAALLAIPMLVATVPLGADDLNHLARIYIRAHIDSDPDLAQVYRIKTDLIPYLGMDLLLTPLARVLPIMALGRLYILALVWGLVAAVAMLQRVFTGRVGLGSLERIPVMLHNQHERRS